MVAVNISGYEKHIRVPVWQIGILDSERIVQIMETNREGYQRMAIFYNVYNGYVDFYLKPESAIIVKNYVPFHNGVN